MYHKVIIIGNLGNDPQMRYTPEGIPVTTFSVATNRRWTNPDGSPGEETIWWRVTAWRKLAETCNQFLSKGRQVYIEAQMRPDPNTGGPRIWTGNDGTARASYEVTAITVKFLGARGEPVEVSEESSQGSEEEIPF
ncbi:MAG: single-stranded DNA-binding protein [Anaerolineae bacterium]